MPNERQQAPDDILEKLRHSLNVEGSLKPTDSILPPVLVETMSEIARAMRSRQDR